MSIAQHYGESVWHKTDSPSLTTLAASNTLQDNLGIPALENQRSIKQKPLIDLTRRPYKVRLGRRVLGDVLDEPEKIYQGLLLDTSLVLQCWNAKIILEC